MLAETTDFEWLFHQEKATLHDLKQAAYIGKTPMEAR
jgi:hypothetical protein